MISETLSGSKIRFVFKSVNAFAKKHGIPKVKLRFYSVEEMDVERLNNLQLYHAIESASDFPQEMKPYALRFLTRAHIWKDLEEIKKCQK
jgi:hypothetical protein